MIVSMPSCIIGGMETSRENAIKAGEKRYLSSRPCKRGHVGYRYSVNAVCAQCDTEIFAVRRRCKKGYTKHKAVGVCDMCGKRFEKSNNANHYCSDICRFFSKVDVRGADECWPWIGACDGSGYGNFFEGASGKRIKASQYSFRIFRGAISGVSSDDHHGTCVCHRCDNRLCVNPAHLFLGSHSANMWDMARKGRHVNGRVKTFGAGDVAMAKRLYATGLSQDKVAVIMGTSQKTIHRMVRDKYIPIAA